jgi:hypothetical protein
MKDLLAKVSQLFERKEAPKRVVRLDDLGFEVFADEKFSFRVPWDGVVEIAAFKHDLFSYDEVCLAYRLRGWDQFWWVGEEDTGFAEVRLETESRFRGISPDWLADVSVPAFEQKWTRIWGAPPQGSL